MDFKDEYKNEMQDISPTEEQCERIRSGVMQKLAENAPAKRKKPLYLRVAAISGAAVCAAAVAIVIFMGTRTPLYISDSNNMAASPEAPVDGMAGGAMNEGSASISSIGGANSSINDCDPDSQKNNSTYHEGSTYESLPSQGYTPDSGDSESEPPTGGIPNIPQLTFSEDQSRCEVIADGVKYTYYTSENICSYLYFEDKTVAADTNLDTELFVQFDENIMIVFSKDGSLFGIYIK